ncbi:tetratricopeptide repeat protein [Rubritalea marina]|uniref:tetratricopeptide repeat protein n=1 Tax=Rubritalea marina TaxID=361055 RepID=UPI0014614657|nr:tetratricopeptide repeat protein [Rubritalea marina]
MKWMTCALSLYLCFPMISAEPKEEESVRFDPQRLIANPVKSLAVPSSNPSLAEPMLLVFSPSMEAQEHVRQGFAWISASWDFEAYRHFCAAVEADRQCLMAYCGIVLALTSPQHEFHEQRAVAYNRMLTLAEYKEEGEFFYPENERMYAVAIAELIVGGVGKSARVFHHLAKTYPNDTMGRLLANYLSRGGYGDLQRPTVRQQRSIDNIQSIVEQEPDDSLALNFLIMLQAEAPQTAVDFGTDLEPLVKKLVDLSKAGVPTWHELHGYIAMRAGMAKVAESSYRKAYSQFRDWKSKNKVTAADSDVILRVGMKLAELMLKQGRDEEAMEVLDVLTKTPLMLFREESSARVLYMWGLQTLPMKAAIANREYALAKKRMPMHLFADDSKDEPLLDILNAYRALLDCHLAVSEGATQKADSYYTNFNRHLDQLVKKEGKYHKHPAYLEYIRSLDGLLIYSKELKSRLVSQDHAKLYWLQLAAETPNIPSRIQPLEVIYPMQYRLGEFFEAQGDSEAALEAYRAATVKDPIYLPAHQAVERLSK